MRSLDTYPFLIISPTWGAALPYITMADEQRPSPMPSTSQPSPEEPTTQQPQSRSTRACDFITRKVLGIDVNERFSRQPDDLDRRAYEVLEPADIYLEQEPSVNEWIKELAPTREGTLNYIQSLFPSSSWIRRYCGRWLLGDFIAGLTIGLVVVPQAMAYAILAQLTPAYGLYTSFTGAVLYWLFGTSKDIVIGTTAVGSLLVGQVVSHVQDKAPGEYANEDIAHALSILAGAVMLFFGLFRLGWIIEFIPYIPISAFVTAASITIMCTQIPTCLGIPGINTRESPYQVIINTLKGLPNAQVDAAIGLGSLVLLFAIRDFCGLMEKRQPSQKRMWSFISSLRLTFVMLLFTLVSYLVNRVHGVDNSPFRIVGHIEPGFQKAGLPRPDTKLLKLILPELPAISIILIIEHIAIAKAMGRLYNYTITPSQEIVALGAANMFSPFVGGYVCTGSFGASAVLSKAGVRTPLAGLFSAGILVLALYVLTAVFQYIPNAALAGLIIHAVCNLLTPPKNLYKYWQLSPLELLIWIVGVVLAIFDSLETSIYAGIALSFVLMLVRLARTKGQFLGKAQARRVVSEKEKCDAPPSPEPTFESVMRKRQNSQKEVFMPLDRDDASNPEIKVESPYPGVFIYRFSEGYNYTNQAMHVDTLIQYITRKTTRTSEEYFEKESDRLWNDPGPRNAKTVEEDLPVLRAVVLDFAAVNNMDITAIQGLIDLRNTLDRYCAPDACELHFANVHNRWTRRALAASGFGYPSSLNEEALGSWQPAYTIAAVLDPDLNESKKRRTPEAEDGDASTLNSEREERMGMASVYGVDRPFFHVDLHEAVDAAVRDAVVKDEKTRRGCLTNS